MHKWIENYLGGFGKKTTHLFTFAQVEALFNAIGTPVIEQFGIGTNFRLHELIPVAYDPLDKRFIR